ncbi:MAG: hypothetical protein ABIO63_03110 [Casimicrobiaceae bacterium]
MVGRWLCLLALAAAAGAGAQEFSIEGNCRDGAPHGAYELRGVNGQVRVVGAFARGKRTGSFLFWSPSGTRIAQLPFEDDVLSGTLALWHSPSDRRGELRPRLEAGYVAGRLHGPKRSWYADGQLRAEYRYDHGALIEVRAFSASGRAFDATEAKTLAAADLVTDERHFASLVDLLRAHAPRCGPPGARLERG